MKLFLTLTIQRQNENNESHPLTRYALAVPKKCQWKNGFSAAHRGKKIHSFQNCNIDRGLSVEREKRKSFYCSLLSKPCETMRGLFVPTTPNSILIPIFASQQ